MSANAESAIERGREAFARRAWDQAHRQLSEADAAGALGVDDLERLAWSAALTGRDEETLSTLERVYQAHAAAGRCARAARAAFWLGFRLFGLGQAARASGWLGRAQRIVEREGEGCVEQGYLRLPEAMRSLISGDTPAACAAARAALEVGLRYGEPDLIAFAQNIEGRALLRQGQVEAGLALLDESMLGTMTGELSPVVTGIIYCGTIASCQRVYALGRAREWTAALSAWCEAQPELVPFTGHCLVLRAELHELGGQWSEAMTEARQAVEQRTGAADAETVGDALYQQAEIHRLRGEYEPAGAAYRDAADAGRDPQPGLALLRLAQGRADAAASAIRRALGATADPLARARLLPAAVDILLAGGDLEEARAVCRELHEIAQRFATDVLSALEARARGAVHLAAGEAAASLEPLRQALRVWHALDAPYLAARVRLLIAEACRALGDQDGAALELGAARRALEQLGARPDLARLAALEQRRPATGAEGLTARELQVLRLVASGKTNKAIAAALCLSEKTVDRHVSNLFTKLNVSSRAAATAHAYEHGLIE